MNTWCLTWHEFQALESLLLASQQKQPWCPTSPQGLHRMWWSDLDMEIFRQAQGSSEPQGGPPPLPWGWGTKTSTRCWCLSTHRCQQWTPSDRRWTHYPSHQRGRHMIYYHSSLLAAGHLQPGQEQFPIVNLKFGIKHPNFLPNWGYFKVTLSSWSFLTIAQAAGLSLCVVE